MTLRTASITAAIAIAGLPSLAAAAEVDFYASNDCRGRPAFGYRGEATIRESCKWSRARCQNDVARSVSVTNWTRAFTIFVHDAPNGSETDDHGGIYFRDNPNPRSGSKMCFRTFERWSQAYHVTQLYQRKDGLDGKVSYVFIRY